MGSVRSSLFHQKKIWNGLILFVLFALCFIQFRIDFTEDKRYTLADSSRRVIEKIKKPVEITVFLDGDFPANFKHFQREISFLLKDIQSQNKNIRYSFINPIAEQISKDSLQAMGMQESILPEFKNGKIQQIVMFPYAKIESGGNALTVPLIPEQNVSSLTEQLQNATQQLEYSIISALENIHKENRKKIGVLINQDELSPASFQEFMNASLRRFDIAPIIPKNDSSISINDLELLTSVDALVVAKPRKKFGTIEKAVLDQYIMRGGKTLWMIDAVNVEMDTLFHQKKIMAYPYDLQLDDLFFSYGFRINPNIVKDYKNAAQINIVTGEVAANPQFTKFIWPYFPLGINNSTTGISKDLLPVKFEFPSSIDTLSRKGLEYKVLFKSSTQSAIKNTPNYISLNELISADSSRVAEKETSSKILALAIQGKFSSAYTHRQERKLFPDFLPISKDNKMIVVADGDVGRNTILKGVPLPIGEDILTEQKFGNAQFLQNALDYLLEDENLVQLRNRSFQQTMLDKNKIEQESRFWQWLMLLLPLLLLGFVSSIFILWHKNKYKTE